MPSNTVLTFAAFLVNVFWNAAWVLAFWHDDVARNGIGWSRPTSADHASLILAAAGRVISLTILSGLAVKLVRWELSKDTTKPKANS